MKRVNCSCIALIICLLAQVILPVSVWAEGENDPLWNRPSYEKKIYDVGNRILAANGITERISFLYVPIDDRNANAQRYWSANTIRVYKDLLDITSSDDELAAILSHEITHIIHRHTRKQIVHSIPTKVLIGAAGVAVGMATAGAAAAPTVVLLKKVTTPVAFAPFDRAMEKDADLTGLDYMVKAGYNPLAMETIMNKGEGDAGLMTRLFASHPMGQERIAYIHEAIRQRYPQFLTEETANNPTPGAPYKLVRDESSANASADPQPEAASSSATPTQNAADKQTQALYDQLAHIADPSTAKAEPAKPSNSVKTPVSDKNADPPVAAAAIATPVSTRPSKMSYQTSKQTLKPAPSKAASASTRNNLPITTNRSVAAASPVSRNENTKEEYSPQTVAQTLLELTPEHLQILRLISRHGYISRQELENQLEAFGKDTVWVLLTDLSHKRLIRIIGAEPEELYVLSEWAAQALEKPTKRTSPSTANASPTSP